MSQLERTVIAGLAATRLIRAWKFEQVGEKPYRFVQDWAHTPVLIAGTSEVNVRATVAREWVGDLAECPHCAGFWLSVLCAIGYRVRPLRPLIEGVAGAMILSTFVQWFPGFSFEEPDPPDPTHVVLDTEATTPR